MIFIDSWDIYSRELCDKFILSGHEAVKSESDKPDVIKKWVFPFMETGERNW
jgi:hypothetical protein